MQRDKIAIIYTTFLRDKLMYETLQSILDNWQDNWVLLVADQGYWTEEKSNFFQDKMAGSSILEMNSGTRTKTEKGYTLINGEHSFKGKNIIYYHLPFDCGLSYARNFLVSQANQMGIPYCLLTADSIKFTESIKKVSNLTYLLDQQPSVGIIGLSLKGGIAWEYRMDLEPGEAFVMIATDDYKEYPIPEEEFEDEHFIYVLYRKVKFKKVDVCKNFFLAKTRILFENPWDVNLKMCEHEDFFWQLKVKGACKVYFTNYIEVEHIKFRPKEYDQYRRRLYEEFVEYLRKKYKIRGWLKYGK